MTHSPPSSGLVDQAQDTVSQAVDQAQQTTGQVTEQAKQQATSQLESQKQRAVDGLVTVAQALRQTGQQLHEQEQSSIAGYVDQAAQRVETVTNHLRARDVPTLVSETEEFARRNPGVFLGAAVVLGLLGGRFLRSSGQRAASQRQANLGTGSGVVPPYASAAGSSGASYTSPGYTAPGYTPAGYTAPGYTAPGNTAPGYTPSGSAYDALSVPASTQAASEL